MGFLKDNAEYFEKKAFEALEEKPRFVLFFPEQAIQLYIKYILAKEFGDYPKTHKISLLFEEFSKITEDAIVIEGKDKPMSDVDVAVVLRDSAGEEERMRLYKKVRKNFGLHPFEIHILASEEWGNRYRRFVRRFVEI